MHCIAKRLQQVSVQIVRTGDRTSESAANASIRDIVMSSAVPDGTGADEQTCSLRPSASKSTEAAKQQAHKLMHDRVKGGLPEGAGRAEALEPDKLLPMERDMQGGTIEE